MRDTFVGPDADAIETFCSVVGNQGQNYKVTRNAAPVDFTIVKCWQVHVDDSFELWAFTDYF
jgi:fatty acid synthase subunit beta